MGMNKKEQAAFADLEYRLRLAKALRFTEPIERDVQPPVYGSGGSGLRKGYDYNAYIGGYGSGPRVEKACTSSVGHCFGDEPKCPECGTMDGDGFGMAENDPAYKSET